MHCTDKYFQNSSIIWPVWLNVECSLTNYVVVGSNPVAVTKTSDTALISSKEFLDIQATIGCRFTLILLHDMIITYS